MEPDKKYPLKTGDELGLYLGEEKTMKLMVEIKKF